MAAVARAEPQLGLAPDPAGRRADPVDHPDEDPLRVAATVGPGDGGADGVRGLPDDAPNATRNPGPSRGGAAVSTRPTLSCAPGSEQPDAPRPRGVRHGVNFRAGEPGDSGCKRLRQHARRLRPRPLAVAEQLGSVGAALQRGWLRAANTGLAGRS